MRESTIDHPSAPVPQRPATDTDKSTGVSSQEYWPRILFVAGGTGAGVALAAGSFTGPIGAFVAGLLGILVGVWVQTAQRSRQNRTL